MEAKLQEIREHQKATWNKFSPGWKKWDDYTMQWLKPMGDEIIRSLELKEVDQVLDIAGGTGEPGLTIASIVKKGKVVISDLAEGMLQVARENAQHRKITNVEFKVCDVSELPFADNSFDAVSCRFGFMFFPDMRLAAKEMWRVLKPGGRVATAVWGVSEKNSWITTVMGTIGRNMQLPSSPAGSPGMFRCAAPGLLAGLFREAGLTNVSEKEIDGKLNIESADFYWQFMNDVAAPVVGALSKADDAMKAKIKNEVFSLLEARGPQLKNSVDYSTLIVRGEK